jgi:hypothetical protein
MVGVVGNVSVAPSTVATIETLVTPDEATASITPPFALSRVAPLAGMMTVVLGACAPATSTGRTLTAAARVSAVDTTAILEIPMMHLHPSKEPRATA